MRDPELEEDCPGLFLGGYEITSAVDPRYNCLSFAVGDLTRFWYDCDVSGYYWPPGIGSADTLDGWLKLFQIHGYTETDDASFESAFEKIVIYAANGIPEHVARQKASGLWTSKMGKGHDIEHPDIECLEGEIMGTVAKIMKRPCKDGKRVLE